MRKGQREERDRYQTTKDRDKSRKPDPLPQKGKSLVNWTRLHGMHSSPDASLFCESGSGLRDYRAAARGVA